jgi:uncharacterized OB-fold protein
MTPEAKPYWDGLKEHKLMMPKCEACGVVFFYPRVMCPDCHSRRLTWIESSGKGKLYSFEIVQQRLNPNYKLPTPYVLAMIELEEGARLMSNLINVEADPRALKCDMPVEVVYEKLTDDITIPLFQPAR